MYKFNGLHLSVSLNPWFDGSQLPKLRNMMQGNTMQRNNTPLLRMGCLNSTAFVKSQYKTGDMVSTGLRVVFKLRSVPNHPA